MLIQAAIKTPLHWSMSNAETHIQHSEMPSATNISDDVRGTYAVSRTVDAMLIQPSSPGLRPVDPPRASCRRDPHPTPRREDRRSGSQGRRQDHHTAR